MDRKTSGALRDPVRLERSRFAHVADAVRMEEAAASGLVKEYEQKERDRAAKREQLAMDIKQMPTVVGPVVPMRRSSRLAAKEDRSQGNVLTV